MRLPVRALKWLDKMVNEQRDIVAPVCQAGKRQFYDINAIIQVLAKFPLQP